MHHCFYSIMENIEYQHFLDTYCISKLGKFLFLILKLFPCDLSHEKFNKWHEIASKVMSVIVIDMSSMLALSIGFLNACAPFVSIRSWHGNSLYFINISRHCQSAVSFVKITCISSTKFSNVQSWEKSNNQQQGRISLFFPLCAISRAVRPSAFDREP